MVKWTNQINNLCVICDEPLMSNSYWVCKKCGKPCKVNVLKDLGESSSGYNLLDIKSECCISDMDNMQKSTCSDQCHEKLIKDLENSYGKEKKIVDMETGKTHRVPIKVIIEKGLNHQDLHNYPEC